jgi:hypothetical protein
MNPPIVRIVQSKPDAGRLQLGTNSKITVNGMKWDTVIGYTIRQGVQEPQEITLTFYADVTIEHKPDDV